MISKAFKETLKGFDLKIIQWDIPESAREVQAIISKIEKNGPEAVEYNFDITGEITNFEPDILVTHFAPITRKMVEAARHLKFIGLMRAGTENVDVKAATQHGVKVFSSFGRNDNAVAEFTVGLVLSEIKNIARGHAALRQGKWRRRYSGGDFGMELEDKNIGIVGFGRVGRLVAKKFHSGFGCNVLAYDPFVSEEEMKNYGAAKSGLAELLSQADIVSLHARLTEETKGLIGAEEIRLMKPNAYIVNTARAGLINKEALFTALLTKKIRGAALDVFWEEPIDINSEFTDLDNVTLTPHYAGTTIESLWKSPLILAKLLDDFFRKGSDSNVVNK
jgi:D-3-phosphoglycerate dehydrogenase